MKREKKKALESIARLEAQKILAKEANDTRTVQNIEKVILKLKIDHGIK